MSSEWAPPPIRFVRMLGSAGRLAGTESQALKLVNHLPDYGYEVHVVWPNLGNPDISKLLRPGIVWHDLRIAFKIDPHMCWRAYRLFKKLKPDVFMGSLWEGIYWGRAAAIAAGVPVVISHSGSYHPAGSVWVRAFDRLLLRGTDVFSGNSLRVIAAEKRRLGQPELPTELFPNNLDIEEFRQATTEGGDVRELAGVGPETVVFIAVGTFRWEKGYDVLLDAWARVGASPAEAKLVIVGAGHDFDKTRALAEDLGIADTVAFPGWRDDVPSLLAGADVFVLSSVSEGSPNVLLEAGAAGLVAVASDAHGSNVRELLVDGVSGLIVEPECAEDLSRALATVLRMSPQQRRQMGEANYSHVAQSFSFDSPSNTVVKIDTVCRRILAEKGRLEA